MSSAGVRLSELMASLSMAIDLTVGQPMDHALRTALLGVHLGDMLGLDAHSLNDVYYAALARYVGCTARATDLMAVFGDEIEAMAGMATLDMGSMTDVIGFLLRTVGRDRTPPMRALTLATAIVQMPGRLEANIQGYCEAGQMLAGRLGIGQPVQAALLHMFERWDGKGLPGGVKGEALALPARIVQVAWDAQIFYRLGGVATAVSTIKQRLGSAYDPTVGGLFCDRADKLLAQSNPDSVWDEALAAEPGVHRCIGDGQLDEITWAFGDFADLKSAYTIGHSYAVAELAAAAAKHLNGSHAEVTTLRRAGYLHDLGRVSVPTSVWDTPGPLSPGNWEKVRLHPYFTERVLARSAVLAPLGSLAALHHERMDGSGYHKGVPGSVLPLSARILAAADCYRAMLEPRAYRPAMSPSEAARQLTDMVRARKLDGDAVVSVLSVAGQASAHPKRQWPAGLSAREVEILRLVARGLTNPKIADLCAISPKTVGHHVQHIYNKIGVATRPGATLFASQHGLLQNEADERG